MANFAVHRPRNVDWKRAAALLYGDWGTSKAYVIGLAFLAAGYASLPIILAVCALTAIVGLNYITVCKYYPDGGGVYSSARSQSRFLAVMGALLLVADLVVTEALSGRNAMDYFGVNKSYAVEATIGLIIAVGVLNYFGPKHSGSFAMSLAVPMVIVVVIVIGLSAPYMTTVHLEPSHTSFKKNWVAFVGVILALSGVESIANLTGVLKADPGGSAEGPSVHRTSLKAILVVAVEVVLGTALLGWAMLSLPQEYAPAMRARYEDMLRFLGETYGNLVLGPPAGNVVGLIVGIVVGLLLLSAVNTAVAALIGIFYLMAGDGEMPRVFTKLNSHGVPWVPLVIATAVPIIVVSVARDIDALSGLYAIGVVGAITVNLGSCTLNSKLPLTRLERGLMGLTSSVLLAVEFTIAQTKPSALFFVVCVLGGGFALRSWAQRRAGFRTVIVSEEVAAHVDPESLPDFRFQMNGGQTIMVAARGITPVLGFALEEARLRQGTLYVLYVKEVAVAFPGQLEKPEKPRWQDDARASAIMYGMLELAKRNNVPVIPLYAVSDDPVSIILDLSATLGVDILMLGASHRRALTSILRGNVVLEVVRHLPENIQLLIHA